MYEERDLFKQCFQRENIFDKELGKQLIVTVPLVKVIDPMGYPSFLHLLS